MTQDVFKVTPFLLRPASIFIIFSPIKKVSFSLEVLFSFLSLHPFILKLDKPYSQVRDISYLSSKITWLVQVPSVNKLIIFSSFSVPVRFLLNVVSILLLSRQSQTLLWLVENWLFTIPKLEELIVMNH